MYIQANPEKLNHSNLVYLKNTSRIQYLMV